MIRGILIMFYLFGVLFSVVLSIEGETRKKRNFAAAVFLFLQVFGAGVLGYLFFGGIW